MGRSAFISGLLLAALSPAALSQHSLSSRAAAIEALLTADYLDRNTGTLVTLSGKTDQGQRSLEATAISTTLYLDALLLQGQQTRARETWRGLVKLATVSGIPGFLARGISSDGKHYAGDPSVMDYAVFHYGMWRYFNSQQATTDEKSEIRRIVAASLARLEDQRFLVCDENGDPTSYFELADPGPGVSEHLLALLLAGYRITGDAHWLNVYHQRLPRRIDRLREYERDAAIPRTGWMMHRCLLSLTTLAELEEEAQQQAAFRQASRAAVAFAMSETAAFHEYLKWKDTAADAERLSTAPVATPIMTAYFPANDPLRYWLQPYWHNVGPKSAYETAPMHRKVWYSAEALAAVMLAGDDGAARKAAELVQELLQTVDFRAFRDVRPLAAALCAYQRGRTRGLFGKETERSH